MRWRIRSYLFNYQHNIHLYNTRSSTTRNFFLEYSRLDKLNMSFSRNGVRIWNSLSNEIRQVPKTKFKRNIHNMLLQKLSDAIEYIDLLDSNMPWKLNLLKDIFHFLSSHRNRKIVHGNSLQAKRKRLISKLNFSAFPKKKKLAYENSTTAEGPVRTISVKGIRSFFHFPRKRSVDVAHKGASPQG